MNKVIEGKIKSCIDILREGTYTLCFGDKPGQETKVRGAKLHAYDLAECAAWSRDPDLRDNHGYLEAWADIVDMTVGEFIDAVEHGKRFNLMLEEAT